MLATKRSAGVAPVVNLSNPLCADDKASNRGNPQQMSPEVQNRSISGPTELMSLWPHKTYCFKQESLPVGCVPTACQPYMLQWPPIISTGEGSCPMNRCPVTATRYHQQGAGAKGPHIPCMGERGQCQVCPHVPSLEGNLAMGPC